MERKTLTEWPQRGAPVPDGLWAYNTSSGLVTDGEFRVGSDGAIRFESSLTGTNWWPCGFEAGETFVPLDDDGEPESELHHVEAPDPDPRIAALEAEVATLRAQLAAPLRLGRGPTHEEVEAHDGEPWLFAYETDPDVYRVTVLSPHPRVKGHYVSQRGGLVTLESIVDAIALNASRQPCGVGVKS